MRPVPMNTELRQPLSMHGDVFPRSSPGGPSRLRAECLIEGSEPHIEVTARFAQAIERRVFDVAGSPVAELIAAGRRYDGGEEHEEHELALSGLPDRTAKVRTAGGTSAELREAGEPAGTVAWTWEPLHATVEAWVEEIAPGLRRILVEVANRLEWDGEPDEQTHLRSLHATHLLLHSPDGAFVSLAHPPTHLREPSAACHNEGLWPTPLGEAGDRRTMLAAPLRLEDYPPVDPLIDLAA